MEPLHEDVSDTTISSVSPRPSREIAADALGSLQLHIGRFVILRELGRGAMGTIYAAFDDKLNRKVALKVMHAMGQRSADVQARMLREAQGLARLSHPNVVQVYEAGADDDGRVFLVMEFIEGETLRAWQRDVEKPRPWRALLTCAVEAGRGLAAAHRAGLVHRDFKPE
ncbi:MAG: serine/threonine protein kinase, partial [Myxococcales bacterium]|nr:serine/threonine protein kinase [Myxococcales bacterium]